MKPEELAGVLDRLLAGVGQSSEVGGATPQEASPPVDVQRLHPQTVS